MNPKTYQRGEGGKEFALEPPRRGVGGNELVLEPSKEGGGKELNL